MKILSIFVHSVNGNSGGELEARKAHKALQGLSEKNENIEYLSINLDEELSLFKVDKPRTSDISARLQLHSTYFYNFWKKNKKKIIDLKPDIVFLGLSRLGFIAKELKNSNSDIKIVTIFQNIELDYINAYFLKYSGIKKVLFKALEKCGTYRDEKNVMKYSDMHVFLTKRDQKRATEIYGSYNAESFVVPICLENGDDELEFSNEFNNFVFLGSLDYPSNKHALMWFIENVWSKIDVEKLNSKLIIGGRKPDDELVKTINNNKNITLYPNFGKKSDIIPQNSTFISPIMFGAGMKVKVAEALSMGLRIIGTEETFVGYEELLEDEEATDVAIKCDTPEGFIKAVNDFSNIDHDTNIKEKAVKLFNKYYSFSRALKSYEIILNKLEDKLC